VVVGVIFIPTILFYSKPVGYADLMIVLAGDEGPRTDYAMSLYKDGVSDQMLMSGGRVYDTSFAMLMKNYVVTRGVPAQDILIETVSTSTYENALFSLALIEKKRLQGQTISSVVVVTSGFHSYRSYHVFRSVFPTDIEVYMIPSDDYGDQIDGLWWTDLNRVEEVGIEFFKLIFYYMYYL
jgi:uncharacterized SAM-binding protein YcdF (DUF218 family)